MYDNLRVKRFGNTGQEVDATPAAADTPAAGTHPDRELPVAPGQKTPADPQGVAYYAVRFCDLNLFRDK